MAFRQVQPVRDGEPQYVYVREPQESQPVGDSPIQQRMEVLQQGNRYDMRPYRQPPMHRGSPIRRKLEQVRAWLHSQQESDPNVGMPLTGR